MRPTQRKGDTAVARAVATFTRLGFDVSIPFTESAAYDLVVDRGEGLKRVQVKYSATGKEVGLRRIHSNAQGYVVRKPIANAYDWLYILDGSGREFIILKNPLQSCITPRDSDMIHRVFR